MKGMWNIFKEACSEIGITDKKQVRMLFRFNIDFTARYMKEKQYRLNEAKVRITDEFQVQKFTEGGIVKEPGSAMLDSAESVIPKENEVIVKMRLRKGVKVTEELRKGYILPG